MSDLISRQAAIDALNKMKIYRPLESDRWVISDCLNKIVNLPSAQPTIEAEPVRRGKWIENRGDIICSQCGIEISEEITWLRGINAEGPFFCPNCGAKMEAAGNEDNKPL